MKMRNLGCVFLVMTGCSAPALELGEAAPEAKGGQAASESHASGGRAGSNGSTVPRAGSGGGGSVTSAGGASQIIPRGGAGGAGGATERGGATGRGGASSADCEGELTFADPALRDAVAQAVFIYGKTPRELTQLGVEGAHSLEGIECLKHLMEVDITSGDADLSPLAHLPLEALSLSNLQNPELDVLTSLDTVTVLQVNDCGVTDLAPVASLSQLAFASFQNNPITDLAPLSGLAQLKDLRIANTHVSDLRPLSTLPALATLDAENALISNLAPLHGMPSLESLNLPFNPIAELPPSLAGMVKLHELNLNDTDIVDVSPLGDLSHLEYLRVDGSPIDCAVLRDTLGRLSPTIQVASDCPTP